METGNPQKWSARRFPSRAPLEKTRSVSIVPKIKGRNAAIYSRAIGAEKTYLPRKIAVDFPGVHRAKSRKTGQEPVAIHAVWGVICPSYPVMTE
ncbi:hypothetical protein CEXT_559981 [Caerostris extrusa]|uniref:Uncharacterized protein n=1 Tax=Caerostris extrusa TaxID=172846 RepID=A0AAV4U428_CAEEX|nr:hypothetical protein CEXT_559981 [Caerostris extrusa]